MPLAAIRSRFTPLTPSTAGDAQDAVPEAERCVTCGRPANTPYCPHCGERRAEDHAYTLQAIVAELWDHVRPADGRSLRSVWTLVRRPGALTAAYMGGMRQPYLSPLRLFLLVNAAYFAYASFLRQHFLTTPLETHVEFGFYAATAKAMVASRLAARGLTFADYARRFDATINTQASTLVGAIAVLFATVVAAVQVRSRRPALHHLCFGLHTIAALLCLFMGPFTVLMLPVEMFGVPGRVRRLGLNPDYVFSAPLLLMLWSWLAVALRRAYGDGRWRAALKGALLVIGFYFVLAAYRALLFFTAFWAT